MRDMVIRFTALSGLALALSGCMIPPYEGKSIDPDPKTDPQGYKHAMLGDIGQYSAPALQAVVDAGHVAAEYGPQISSMPVADRKTLASELELQNISPDAVDWVFNHNGSPNGFRVNWTAPSPTAERIGRDDTFRGFYENEGLVDGQPGCSLVRSYTDLGTLYPIYNMNETGNLVGSMPFHIDPTDPSKNKYIFAPLWDIRPQPVPPSDSESVVCNNQAQAKATP